MNDQNEMFGRVVLGEAPALIERRDATFQQEAPRHPTAAFALAPEQAAAQEAALAFIAGAAPGAYFAMHGLAGTGKTVVLASLAAQLEERGKRYMLAAPTGKAATVLTRKAGKSVKTLHRLLYAPPEERDGRLTWSKAWPPGSLAGSVVLLDEASMVDKQLAADLLETGAVVVAFGDPGQLSPVTVAAYQPADGLCGELTVDGGKKLEVWLDDEKDAPRRCIPCAMAYAITVHKSQGSEWLRVLILDDHTSNDRKEWLYTAITRAASEVRIVPPASRGP
jgi:ATP-dependent exoDNAse (exonuclease V) alpha subunit